MEQEIKFYIGDVAPSEDTIFVFGSNPEGRHGAGAAKVAREKFGAIYGRGEGLQGSAYALPTKELRWEYRDKSCKQSISRSTIIGNIKKMYECAKANPDKKFKVAYRNQPDVVSLCGYSGKELISMFKEAAGEDGYPENIYFSKEWADTGLL